MIVELDEEKVEKYRVHRNELIGLHPNLCSGILADARYNCVAMAD